LPLFPIQPGRFRVTADAGDATTAAPRPDPTVEEIQAILDRRGPGGIKASDPIWLTCFRINERKVKDYHAHRVFLPADSAPIRSPGGRAGDEHRHSGRLQSRLETGDGRSWRGSPNSAAG